MRNFRKTWSGLLAACGLVALIGCGGVTAPPVTVTPGTTTTYGATNASVYVIQGTSTYTDQIFRFASGSSGSVTPAFTATTNLYLTAVAVDSTGNIYAAGLNNSSGVPTINIYPPNSNTVGTFTIPAQPIAIAVDSTGTIYVTDNSSEILVYPAGASTPSRTIAGASTMIATPQAIAVDSAGTVYLSSYTNATGASSILMFNSAATGNVAPTGTLTAPSGVAFYGVAVDAAKNIYSSTDSLGSTSVSSIVKYAPGSTGSATPIATITGSNTLLSSGSTDVGALALDSAGNMYLPLESSGSTANSYSVLEFTAGSNGNATPAAKISSASWTNAGAQIAAL